MKYTITNDTVLPTLIRRSLKPGIDITIEIRDGSVHLYIGPRDWQWDQETGEWIGQGTSLKGA